MSDTKSAEEASRLTASHASEVAQDSKAIAAKLDEMATEIGRLAQETDALGSAAEAAAVASGTGIDPFIFRLTIFVLSIFVGYYVVWNVTPALHTPLMSVTNAISSVIIVGAILALLIEVPDAAGADTGTAYFVKGLGFFAVLLASVNIFGGFLVTQRMLAMYKAKSD